MQALAGEQAPASRPLPQGSPFNPLFRRVGEAGFGFGVPFTAAFGGLAPGGLQAFDGVIPVGDPWNSPIPGYGTYMDALHGNATSPDDLTNAIEMVASPGIGSALEDGLTDGVRVGAEIIEDDGQATGAAEAAAKGVQDASGSAAEGLATPYGVAEQGTDAASQALRSAVENGAPVYRQGSFGVQQAAEGQFWAGENPLTTPNYAAGYGTPGSAPPDWVMGGEVNPGEPFATRPAPGLGGNEGGNPEVVTRPGGVGNIWFHMP